MDAARGRPKSASSLLVVKVPAAAASAVTLESLTRSYREGLLPPRADDETGEDDEAKAASSTTINRRPPEAEPQRRRRQRRPLTALAPPPTETSGGGGGRRETAPLPPTLFDTSLRFSGQLYRPPGYFLVTPRLGERSNLEWRRRMLRNSRRGGGGNASLQILGEPYWSMNSIRQGGRNSRPATARQEAQKAAPGVDDRENISVSLTSLIKRFPEDFVRLPTPNFRSGVSAGGVDSCLLAGSSLGMSHRMSISARLKTHQPSPSPPPVTSAQGSGNPTGERSKLPCPQSGLQHEAEVARTAAPPVSGERSLRLDGRSIAAGGCDRQQRHRRCRSAPPRRENPELTRLSVHSTWKASPDQNHISWQ